jgi:hypothetical protein
MRSRRSAGRMRGRAALSTLALCAVWLPASARAFSDPASFEQSTAAAGGGGRHFTGSPADGYTCKVCHEGGAEPPLRVLGLPFAGYRPGTAYEIMVDWPDSLTKFAAALEMTDLQGRRAGSLRLPPQAELLPPELCEPVSDGVGAGLISETSDGRQIIAVPDCGAKRLRFLWTAPDKDSGRVWFSGSAVVSNGEADVLGDGVTDFGRVIGPANSAQPLASQTTASCSVARARGGSAWYDGLVVGCGYVGWRRSRRRRSTQ